MTERKPFKGTWVERFFTILLSLVLGVLLFWFLSFITRDTRARLAAHSFTRNVICAVTFAVHCCLTSSIAETKDQIRQLNFEQGLIKNPITGL
jgi:predicted PurR-regulated permease PerM